MGEARHQSSGDRISRDRDDRYRGRGHRERFDQAVGIRKDHVWVAAYDRGGERGKALGAALGRIALDDEIASLGVAKRAQCLVEPPYPERAGGLGEQVSGNAGMDERDAVLLLGLLRMCAKRKRNSRATQDTEKISPPHSQPLASTKHRISSSECFDRG